MRTVRRSFSAPGSVLPRPPVRAALRAFLAIVLLVPPIFAVSPRSPAEAAWITHFVANVNSDTITGDAWMPGLVTISVDSPEIATVWLTAAADTSGHFEIDASPKVDLKPGCTIVVADGSTSKTLTIGENANGGHVWADSGSNLVEGDRAMPRALVETSISGSLMAPLSAVADDTGYWLVDYNKTWDLLAGTTLVIRVYNEKDDAVEFNAYVVPNPDGDGTLWPDDNCPRMWNWNQYDGDGDGIGTACDPVDRLWGSNRYGTSSVVADTNPHSDTAFIASGTNFPDALVAAAAAGFRDAPVLLTDGSSLSPETEAALTRNPPWTVYLVGGTAVISPKVEQQIKGIVGNVVRVAGKDRYATSAAVSKRIFAKADTVFVALGTNFPDALVAAAAAGFERGPVLLTAHDHVPAPTIAELNRLHPKTIYVVGGPAAISEAAAAQLAPYATTVQRLAGRDRYETGAAVAGRVFNRADHVFIACGGNFPDALVAAAAAGHFKAPVLLVTHDLIPASTRRQLDRLKPDYTWMVGGRAVIGESVANALPTVP